MCFARVIFWKVRRYELKSLSLKAKILGKGKPKASERALFFIHVFTRNMKSSNFARNQQYVSLHTKRRPALLMQALLCSGIALFSEKVTNCSYFYTLLEPSKVIVKTHAFWTTARAGFQPLRAHGFIIRNTLPLTGGWVAGWAVVAGWRVGLLVGWLAGWLG